MNPRNEENPTNQRVQITLLNPCHPSAYCQRVLIKLPEMPLFETSMTHGLRLAIKAIGRRIKKEQQQ